MKDEQNDLSFLPWQAGGFEFDLATTAWNSQLRAAGWLDSRARTSSSTPRDQLHAGLRAETLEELTRHLGARDPIYPNALLLTAWADTVIAGDEQLRKEFADHLTQGLADYDAHEPLEDDLPPAADADLPPTRILHEQVRRMVDAALAWARQHDSSAAPRVPQSDHGSRHLLGVASQALADPAFPDWTYHGIIDTEDCFLIAVEYDDGSRLLLRDREAGARGLFAWGYGGNGPCTLAEVLADHLAGDLLRCGDCLGASPVSADIIPCAVCNNSGHRPGRSKVQELLLNRVIVDLPTSEPAMQKPAVVWTRRRTELLRELVGRPRRSSSAPRPTPPDR